MEFIFDLQAKLPALVQEFLPRLRLDELRHELGPAGCAAARNTPAQDLAWERWGWRR
jgi:hypothetical protein